MLTPRSKTWGAAATVTAVLVLSLIAPSASASAIASNSTTTNLAIDTALDSIEPAAEPDADPGLMTVAGSAAGGAGGALCGAALGAGIVGGLLLVFGTPDGDNGPAQAAFAAGAFFYAFPFFAFPALGAALGTAGAGLLLGRPLDEQLATEVALAGGVGFCGSLACLPVSWWLVSIPTLIAILVLGDSIALPALGIAATAFLPIWAGFSGAAAAGGRMAGQLILAPEGTATNEANTTQPLAPMRY